LVETGAIYTHVLESEEGEAIKRGIRKTKIKMLLINKTVKKENLKDATHASSAPCFRLSGRFLLGAVLRAGGYEE
jgi:hypothetical protein